MGDTTISWTDKTWNFLRGCSRVSAGCMNCYAERIATRFGGDGMPYEGLVTIRSKHPQTGRPTTGVRGKWTGVVRFIPEVLAKPLHWQLPQKVFVNSMSDLFHENVTDLQIAAAFGVMAACPHHTFQILTKRMDRALIWYAWILRAAASANDGRGMTPAARCVVEAQAALRMVDDDRLTKRRFLEPALAAPWPLPNVWVGASVENQEAADERVPLLLQAPAAVRFLSCEPLLGPLDLRLRRTSKPVGDRPAPLLRDAQSGGGHVRVGEQSLGPGNVTEPQVGPSGPVAPTGPSASLSWVIAGCESGPGRRGCDVAWLRSLRNQCDTAEVAFFLKQAEQEPDGSVTSSDGSFRKGTGKIIELPYLDGVQHAAFPEAA